MKHITDLATQLQLWLRWQFIHRLRRQALALLFSGAACSDPRLVKLSNRIQAHGLEVSQLWKRQKYGHSMVQTAYYTTTPSNASGR